MRSAGRWPRSWTITPGFRGFRSTIIRGHRMSWQVIGLGKALLGRGQVRPMFRPGHRGRLGLRLEPQIAG
jgi:hypothetical protein